MLGWNSGPVAFVCGRVLVFVCRKSFPGRRIGLSSFEVVGSWCLLGGILSH
ncbi:hypothetical protein RISK_006729 [Rhodopirellula islandica]|uniref:Uncharacterized protein n=1 Tax=Rhodopirellula islandica TaxID=595434 RepID=A0A0J1B2L4_RHOIS|nr:hypothetical protein RISK_006729 [Rhodopirellula islandica]